MTATRKALRHATVAQVKAGVPALGQRVFASRAIPVHERQLPCALVYTEGEQIGNLAESTKHHARRVRLVVTVLEQGFDQVDDSLDDLAAAVEAAIYSDATVGGTVADVTLAQIEGPALVDTGARVDGEIRLVYEALYDTEYQEPESELVDLETVRVEYETHAPRAGAEAADLIEVEVAP